MFTFLVSSALSIVVTKVRLTNFRKLQGDTERDVKKKRHRNTDFKGACMYLYDSEHRFRARVLFSLLLKAEIHVKVSFWAHIGFRTEKGREIR